MEGVEEEVKVEVYGEDVGGGSRGATGGVGGRGVHLAGDSSHTDSDVLLAGCVQVFPLDCDDGSPGCRASCWLHLGGFGVLVARERWCC